MSACSSLSLFLTVPPPPTLHLITESVSAKVRRIHHFLWTEGLHEYSYILMMCASSVGLIPPSPSPLLFLPMHCVSWLHGNATVLLALCTCSKLELNKEMTLGRLMHFPCPHCVLVKILISSPECQLKLIIYDALNEVLLNWAWCCGAGSGELHASSLLWCINHSLLFFFFSPRAR